MLVKKYEITQNRSLDAMDDIINRKKMTEFGNMALIEEREDSHNGPVALRLPGVRSGDMASRSFKPEVRVSHLQFSPNGKFTIFMIN
jgi:periodic tryptophan protein 2